MWGFFGGGEEVAVGMDTKGGFGPCCILDDVMRRLIWSEFIIGFRTELFSMGGGER